MPKNRQTAARRRTAGAGRMALEVCGRPGGPLCRIQLSKNRKAVARGRKAGSGRPEGRRRKAGTRRLGSEGRGRKAGRPEPISTSRFVQPPPGFASGGHPEGRIGRRRFAENSAGSNPEWEARRLRAGAGGQGARRGSSRHEVVFRKIGRR